MMENGSVQGKCVCISEIYNNGMGKWICNISLRELVPNRNMCLEFFEGDYNTNF